MADHRRRRAPTSRLRPGPVYPRSSIWAVPRTRFTIATVPSTSPLDARDPASGFGTRECVFHLNGVLLGQFFLLGPSRNRPRARPRMSSSQRPLPLGADASPTTMSTHPAGADRWPTCRQRPESFHPSWRAGVRCRSLLREIPRGWLHAPRNAALFIVQSEALRSVPAPRAG